LQPRDGTDRLLRVAAAIRRATLTSPDRSWLLSATFALPAALLWWRLHALGPSSSPEVAWWALALLFFVTERAPLSGGNSRSLASVGVGAGPIVIGMFYSTPLAMLAGVTLGATASTLTRRPLRLARAVSGLVQYALFLAVAIGIFRPLTGGGEQSWYAWAAAAGAAGVVALGRAAGLILSMPGRQALRGFWSDAGVAGVVAVASACFGLLTVVLIRADPLALVLISVTGASTLIVYRTMARERQLRFAVEFLHGAGDALQGSRELETAVVELLRRARTMFSAQVAQLTIFPAAAGEKALRTTVRHDGSEEVMAPLPLSQLDDVLEADTDGVIIDRRASTSAAEMLARRDVGEAMVALLRGQSRMLGSLLVGGHVDARPFDSRDLQLFQTLAIQTTSTLENGRLERSIARLTELQEQLTHQAFHDSLTDLANRSLFGDRIDQGLARSAQAGKRLAVIFIDLDDFKAVNDTLGHAAGDALLVGVAERLRGCLRRPDTAARLGGDEFAVLLEDLADPSEADIVARRIFDALKAPFEVMGNTVSARGSLGVAVADVNGDNASKLMRHADVAMYAAKAAGKDRFVMFAPGMETEIISRHKLRNDLDQALVSDQLTVHYQPIVDLRDGDLIGVEALVRWRHPQRGLVGPTDFIPFAEETGQILQIGDYVLRSACATTLRWQARYPRKDPLIVSVNISARQLQQPMFVESVVETVQREGLRPESLVLELTESILLEDAAISVAKLETLRRAGIRIAIDDFGTGYSSLSYLRRLPVDMLKIAKPFVDDLALDEPNGDFARAIVGIGAALRLSLVAEGIECAEQVTRLRELGCTQGQGYYLSHPVRAGAIDEILAEGGAMAARLSAATPAEPQVIPLHRR
jgi:diguanylate cyclase (GGDEF)-like protein